MAWVFRFVAAASVLLLTSCGGGDEEFSFPPYSIFWSVAVGDFNGDGFQDVAASYSYIDGPPPHQGYVVVYLQDPAHPGTFTAARTYAAGYDPYALVAGDVDGDGRTDIVVANGNGAVSVLRQDPANAGQFLAAVTYATGYGASSVALGDLNGDGKPDIAVGVAGGVSVLFQDPAAAGSFLSATAVNFSNGAWSNSVAIGDMDGDGKADLVAATSQSILVLRQDPLNPGIFLPPSSYLAGAQPASVAIGDLDGDHRPDIAVANFGTRHDPSTSSTSVLLQNAASPGSFLPAVNYTAGYRSQTVAIADLNGDGRPDLVVANNGYPLDWCPPDCVGAATGVSVLLQSGATPGQFLAAVDYPATSDYVQAAVVGDVNGDGKPDLVIALSGSVVVRFQDPANPGQFGAAVAVSP